MRSVPIGQTGTWYALDRDTDVSGVSGVGRVAYALHCAAGVFVVWDTVNQRTGRHTRGSETLEDLETLIDTHCYGGKTRLTPLNGPGEEDWVAVQRAEELLAAVRPRVAAMLDEWAGEEVGL